MPDFGTARYRALFDVSNVLAGAATIRSEMASLQGAGGSFATSMGAGLQRVGGAMKQTGRQMTTGLTLPIVATGVKFVGTAKDIDSAWNEVRRTMNGTPAEIEAVIRPTGAVGKAVTDLSIRFGITREEVIGVAGQLSAMGKLDPTTHLKSGMDLLAQSINFAVAGGVELEDGFNAVVGTASAFGLQGAALQDSLYGLNRIENETKANAYDLSIGLSRASGAAATLVNDSFSASDGVATIAASMATLKERNIETARSANATRAIFQQLYAIKPGTGDFWKKMGVDRADAEGNLKPINQLLGEMADKMGNLTQEERSNFFRKQIGIEFGPMLQLLLDDIAKTDEGMSTFSNSMEMMGQTAQGQASYLNELNVQENSLDAITGRVGATWDLLVDQMTPVIREILPPLLDFVTRLINAFAGLSPEVQKFVVIGAAIAAVLGPVLIVLGAIVGAIGSLIGAFAAIGASSVFTGIAAAFAEGGLLGALGAIGALLGPVILIIGALVGAFILIRDNWDKLQPVFEQVFNTLSRLLVPAFKDIMRSLKSLMPVMKILGALLIGTVIVAVVALALALRGIAAVLKVVAGIVGWFAGLIVSFFQWLYDVLVGHSIIPDLIDAFRYWFELGLAIITTIFNAIKGVFETIWNAIKAVVEFVVGLIWTVIQFYMNAIKTIIETVLGVISGVFSTVWGAIRAVIETVWGAISAAVETGINAVKSVIETVLGTIGQIWNSFWNGLKGGLSAIWSGIQSAVAAGINLVIDVINFLIGGVNAILGVLPGNLKISTLKHVGGGTASSGRSDADRYGMATGGRVPGTGNRDSVPAMLTPGEFVIRKKAVQALGVEQLERLNALRFGVGGLVGGLGSAVGGGLSDIGDFAGDVGGAVVGGVKAAGRFTVGVAQGALGLVQDAAGAIKDVAEKVARYGAGAVYDQIAKAAKAGLNALPIGNSTVAQMIRGIPIRAIDAIGDLIRGKETESQQGGTTGAGASANGLNPEFLRRFNLYSQAVGGLRIVSGFRSRAAQQRLYDLYRAGKGNVAAPPGHSNHERGLAIDHDPRSTAAMRSRARGMGLYYPMSYEPWHVQPVGLNRGGVVPHFRMGGLVGADGLGVLHKREMVLPPSLSTAMQEMAKTGGGGGRARNVKVEINNPIPEKPSKSLYRAGQKLAVLGLLEDED